MVNAGSIFRYLEKENETKIPLKRKNPVIYKTSDVFRICCACGVFSLYSLLLEQENGVLWEHRNQNLEKNPRSNHWRMGAERSSGLGWAQIQRAHLCPVFVLCKNLPWQRLQRLPGLGFGSPWSWEGFPGEPQRLSRLSPVVLLQPAQSRGAALQAGIIKVLLKGLGGDSSANNAEFNSLQTLSTGEAAAERQGRAAPHCS